MPSTAIKVRGPRVVSSRLNPGGSQAPARQPLGAIAWSGIGAFAGIYLIGALGPWLRIASLDGFFLIGSFGATAVLVYGAPAAEFSQPRNVVGGHVVAALIGVCIHRLASELGLDTLPTAAAAVALSIVGMHLTKTLHPPGGATALIAVIGSPSIHAMGYRYVLSPVLLGALLMLGVALLLNNVPGQARRRYPRYWY